MLRYALIFGLPAGLVTISIMTASMALGGPSDEVFGYLVMLVALLLIYLGVRRYRDRELGGVIGFGRALGLGLLMAVVAGVAYAIAWEAYIAVSGHDFFNEYAASVIETMRAAGRSAEEIAAQEARIEGIRAAYANPVLRFLITLTEIVPVGVIVALVSAALVRTRPVRGGA